MIYFNLIMEIDLILIFASWVKNIIDHDTKNKNKKANSERKMRHFCV